jgi:hypothetical protein
LIIGVISISSSQSRKISGFEMRRRKKKRRLPKKKKRNRKLLSVSRQRRMNHHHRLGAGPEWTKLRFGE